MLNTENQTNKCVSCQHEVYAAAGLLLDVPEALCLLPGGVCFFVCLFWLIRIRLISFTTRLIELSKIIKPACPPSPPKEVEIHMVSLCNLFIIMLCLRMCEALPLHLLGSMAWRFGLRIILSCALMYLTFEE
jgi:hypothetical protein